MKLDQFQNSNLWIKRVLETIYGHNGREDIINEMIQEHFSEMKGLWIQIKQACIHTMTNIHNKVYHKNLDHCRQMGHLVSFQRQRERERDKKTENLIGSSFSIHQIFQSNPGIQKTTELCPRILEENISLIIILQSTKLLIKWEGRIKTYSDMWSFMTFSSHKVSWGSQIQGLYYPKRAADMLTISAFCNYKFQWVTWLMDHSTPSSC